MTIGTIDTSQREFLRPHEKFKLKWVTFFAHDYWFTELPATASQFYRVLPDVPPGNQGSPQPQHPQGEAEAAEADAARTRQSDIGEKKKKSRKVTFWKSTMASWLFQKSQLFSFVALRWRRPDLWRICIVMEVEPNRGTVTILIMGNKVYCMLL